MKQSNKLKLDNLSIKADKKPSTDSIKKAGRYSHMVFQLAIVIGVVSILLSNRPSEDTAKNVVDRSGAVYSQPATLDEVSAADVASKIARSVDLIVADNVINHADSLEASVQSAAAESTVIDKPQIVSTELKTADDIQEYVVKEGETIADVAKRFNITSDTIKWENDLTGNFVGVGKKLSILPVNGVRHKVASGDTIQSIADEYKGNTAQIVAFNDLEVEGIETKVDQFVIIPNGEKKVAVPVPTSTATSTINTAVNNNASAAGVTYSFGSGPLYGGNGYSAGYCTWHAANRRAQIGRPIPRNLGNAVTWASLAASAGFAVDGNPQAGDVFWDKRTYLAGGLGHVGFVENVNPDGSILISDMNFAGWNVLTTRTVAAADVGTYLFIH